MTDKELLELAAKAAGYGEVWYLEGYETPYIGKKYDGTSIGYRVFRPLDDDGDAFRLAVKLRVSIVHDKDSAEVTYGGSYESPMFVVEDNLQDPYAATRRAIVRAAAEIGRSMK